MRNALSRSLVFVLLILGSLQARVFAEDLAVTKQAGKFAGGGFTNQFRLGDTFAFTITFTNVGPATVSNIIGSDVLPAGLSFSAYLGAGTSGGTAPVYNRTNGAWTLDYLEQTNFTRLFIFATATNVGTFTNTAIIAGSDTPDPNTNNNSASVIITVVAVAPAVTNQPQSQTVAAGSNVTFTVGADGSRPLSYQWRFKGTGLPNATNATLTITNVQPADAGDYDVVVTNIAGMDTSFVAVLAVDQFDFGDAPAPYPTKLADNGARHKRKVMPDGYILGLGFSWDAELDGQPDATGTGDDNVNQADEDGLTISTLLVQGQQVTISVWASHDARLDAWVDFNANGSWADAGEKTFNNEALTEGPNSLKFDVPAGATVGNTFARFRISTAGGLAPTGEAADGEVEDYSVFIRQAPVANVAVRGPFVFKNTSAFDATTLRVVFTGTGGQLVNPTITMEPEDANGVPTVVGGNTVSNTWVNKIRRGGLIAFSVQCPGGPIQVNSVQWSDGANSFAGTLHANLDSAQAIPTAPFDLRFRVRKSYKDYLAADLNLLMQAMLMLHDPAKAPPRDVPRPLKPGDPHDRYEEYVLMHDLNQTTAHGGSHFTPWHRKLLLDFENDLRALDPLFKDLTVPFWDWTLADNNPFTGFLGGNGDGADRERVQGGPFGKTMNQWRTYAYQNSLKNWQRGYLKRGLRDANFNDSSLKKLGPGARTAALNEGDYAKFRRIWEFGVKDPADPAPKPAFRWGTHNDAHGWVGGDLGEPTRGVNEPGFWLLHSFIDETWAEWQCKYGVDTFATFPGTQAATSPMKGFPGTPPPAANTMFNYLTLGFTYERSGVRVDSDPKCKVPKALRMLIDQIGENLHRLRAQTRIGFSYQLRTSTDLLAWTPVQTVVATNDMTEFFAAASTSDSKRFYLVSQLVGGPFGTNFVVESFADENQGHISPAGVLTANAGEAVNFLATPLPGFAVDQWYVDGNSAQTAARVFTLTNVQGDHSVSVGFYDLTAPSADLVVSLTPSTNVASMGEPVTYSIVVSNTGPSTADAVLVVFEPEHMSELVEATASQGTVEIMGDPPLNVHHVRLALDQLNMGSAATLAVTLMHHEAGPATGIVWAIATERDPTLGNSEASITITVLP